MAPFHVCCLGFWLVVMDLGFISHNNSSFCFKAFQKFLAGINTSFFQFCCQLAWLPPCRHYMELQNFMDVWCADPWLISRCAAISFTVMQRFSFTMATTAAMASGVTTRCAWPGRGESVTELMLFMNFLVHSYTCCGDRHASPYWTFMRRWVLMDFTPSLLQKQMTEYFSFGACCKRGRHLYTTTALSCCIPASYWHLSSTLQTMSIIVVNLQDNRAVFRIFITLLRYLFDSPSYHH